MYIPPWKFNKEKLQRCTWSASIDFLNMHKRIVKKLNLRHEIFSVTTKFLTICVYDSFHIIVVEFLAFEKSLIVNNSGYYSKNIIFLVSILAIYGRNGMSLSYRWTIYTTMMMKDLQKNPHIRIILPSFGNLLLKL